MQRVLAFLLALVAVANAFVSQSAARQNSRSVSMNAKSKSLPFMPQPPNLVGMAGNVGFDPLGFSNIVDVKWLREAELKHGRICMLAALGVAATSVFQLPGETHQGISVVAAHDVAVKSGALSQINLFISAFEIISIKAVKETMEGSARAPGYFGFDPLKFSTGKSDAVKADLAEKELANGRLAMLAFSGMITQAVLTGKEFPFL